MRDQILDAADRLLTRFGYRKMTVDDLAAEAGIGKGTVYLYFPSKQEVALCWIDRTILRLVDQHRAVAAETDLPAGERVRRMLLTRVTFLFDSSQDRQHVLEELYSVLRAAYMPRRQSYLRWEGEVFAEVVREGQSAGELRPGDPDELALALLLATNALLPYSLGRRGERNRDAVLRNAESVVELLLHGLCAREEPALPAGARARHEDLGFRPFERRGVVVTNELVDRLREELGE